MSDNTTNRQWTDSIEELTSTVEAGDTIEFQYPVRHPTIPGQWQTRCRTGTVVEKIDDAPRVRVEVPGERYRWTIGESVTARKKTRNVDMGRLKRVRLVRTGSTPDDRSSKRANRDTGPE